MNNSLEPSWNKVMREECAKMYYTELTAEVTTAYLTTDIFPPPALVFKAFELCPFDTVRVVILGQDPYHGSGQAHGLSFSVPNDVKIPPSLKNIYKELAQDLGKPIPTSGNLEHWAKQGVLLLNSILTVQSGQPGSHQRLGWEQFTDALIKKVSDDKQHVVFLLWGNYARAKKSLIDTSKHLVLEAPHPSPLSAYTGFFGSKHFSKTNDYLRKNDLQEIEW